jgi:hypothetical protein
VDIPGLGPMTYDEQLDWYRSVPRPIAALGGAVCQVVLDGYDGDPDKDEVRAVIGTFLGMDDSALRAAAPAIFDYYSYITEAVIADDDMDWYVEVTGPDDVWNHIEVGPEAIVKRDDRVYVRVPCECDWEEEHGLDVVFRDGRTVTKVGPSDGHLTNNSAYGRGDLHDVVYRRPGG